MFTHFEPSLLAFLQQLKANNNKEWFHAHKQDYETQVRAPALAFIGAMESWIKMISPHYEAVPKKVGGSLMRVYRDIRFSKDKSPYKTNLGIQFRHEVGKDVHAPGFYLHIEPDEIFLGVGTWHPPADSLRAIRDLIVAKPNIYQDALEHAPFSERYELVGDSLSRPPKGYDKAHPLIDEIKRKDFIAISMLQTSDLYQHDICERIAKCFGKAQPLMKFLCEAEKLRF